MTTHIQPLSCQQNYTKIVPQKAIVPLSWKGPRYSYEWPPSTPGRGNRVETIPSKFRQSKQEIHDDVIKVKQNVNEKGKQPSSNSPKYHRETKQKKRRSNRDSIFSFMSIILKNEDGRPTEGKDTESKEEISSPVYSQISFLSSSSTIDIPSQVKTEKTNNSANVLTPACVSMNQSRSSISSLTRMSASFKCGIRRGDIPKRTSLQLRSDKCQKNSEKNESHATDSLLGSDKNCLNFFQEQQEQEYRIAKAWLEAEESRKTGQSSSTCAIKSGSTEYQWNDAWIKKPNSDNIWHPNKMTLKHDKQNVAMGHSHLRPKVIYDIDVPLDGDFSTGGRVTGKTYLNEEENNSKRKRISGMVNLANGVRGWLSRRVRSN